MHVFVDEHQLDAWVRGNPMKAIGGIPELILRLVAASSPHPLERRFQLKNSTNQHGPDGILVVDQPNEPYIPNGRSYWEIGTGLDPRAKANEVYNSSIDSIPPDERNQSTFIFVSPLSPSRTWEYTRKRGGQISWIEERKKRMDWKDIRIIDGTKLTEWLSHYESVGLWTLGEINNLHLERLETAEQRWSLLRSYGAPPPLISEVFLCERKQAGEKLQKLFDGEITQINFVTHFPEQIVDFVAAYINNLDNDRRLEITGRCLFVHDSESWIKFCASGKPLILVAGKDLDLADQSGSGMIQKARNNQHAIIFGGPPGGMPDPSLVPLPAPRAFNVQEALVRAGYPEERARMLSQKSEGNLGALLRCLQNVSLMPEWVQQTEAAEIAIATLLGSWLETSIHDVKVAEVAAGKPYGEWIEKVRKIALLPGTPLTQRDGIWKFRTRYEGWYYLGPKIFDEHIDRIIECIKTVLSEKDPIFDVEPDKRYAISIFGEGRKFSEYLRKGLAELLALMGTHSKALISCTRGSVEVKAAIAVRGLLADCDWVRWGSLNDQLPLLAEASPSEFLDAVDFALCAEPCPFDMVFKQESSGIAGRSYITGLLWAMETLAWDQNLLGRVVVCLGGLTSRDPGGHYGNRPGNSLRTILLPWCPQTTAPIPKRVAAVKSLIEEYPESGWKLLLSLLPNPYSVSDLSMRPAWRNFIPPDFKTEVTVSEYWDQVMAYAELSIIMAKNDHKKLPELVKHLEHLPPPCQESILAYLKTSEFLISPHDDLETIWTVLSDLVRTHRKYSKAKWAMSEDRIEKIEKVIKLLEPFSGDTMLKQLFCGRDFELFEDEGDFNQQYLILEEKRSKAVQQIINTRGFHGLLEFASQVESSLHAGLTTGMIAEDGLDSIVLPSMLQSSESWQTQFANGFVLGRFHGKGWKWVDALGTDEWGKQLIGKLLSLLPFQPITWSHAKSMLGCQESEYWERARVNPFEKDTDLQDGAKKLIEYQRSDAAIQCIARLIQAKSDVDSKLATTALISSLKIPEKIRNLGYHEIEEVIKYLENTKNVDQDELLKIEWGYLSLFEHHFGITPNALWLKLARNPEVFCEIIRLLYRPEGQTEVINQPSTQEKNLALNAYELLRTWKMPPGLLEDDTFNGSELISWLDAVKKICEDSGHLKPAMIWVGRVLSHVPPDPNGLWIDRAAAKILNAKDSEHIREGFVNELFNSRGVHWADPSGASERNFFERYKKMAEDVDLEGYVRLASCLRELAQEYLREIDRIPSERGTLD